MLAGDPPFVASSPRAVLAKHMTDPAPPITTVRSDVPKPVAASIARALGKAAVARFESAETFSQALFATEVEHEEDKKSIVVLPFENLSPDPDNEYFSDGLTDELIADLSKLHSLRVISRNSAMQLKGTDKDTVTIGKELRVQYVLEGTVRRAGNRLRITAQLIDADEDVHLWTEKYDGVLEDVFDMQEQVSHSIVDALELRLTPHEEEQLERREIEQVQAYEYYLRARYEIGLFSKESLDRALELVDRGIEIAGDNELLYALKGGVYLQYVNTMSGPPETYPQLLSEGQRFAEKALELNPRSAEGECTFGIILHQSGNPKASISHIDKALRLSPDLAEANAMLGFQLAAAGTDPERAGRLLDKAGELDPLTWWFNRGWLHMYSCDFERALTSFRVGQQVSENSKSPVRMFFVWLHAARGNNAEAFRLVDQMASDAASHPMTSAGLFLKHALLGEKQQALDAVSEDLRAAAWWDDQWSLVMADGYALIEELDDAFHWLDHAIDYGYCSTRFLEGEPLLANLRTDERFHALLEKATHMSQSLLD
jgi:TolB-like protein/Flp pilus assembly protein TadD